MGKQKSTARANGNNQNDNSSNQIGNDVLDEKIERSKYIYGLVNGWIENADNKVNVSCAIFSAVFGVITFLAQTYIKEPNVGAQVNDCMIGAYRTAFIASAVLMAIAIFFYVKAIIPNLNNSGGKNEKKKCPIYYGDISKMQLEDYRIVMDKATENQFYNEIVTEIHFNSQVCMKKMERYKIAVKFSTAAIAFAVVSLIARFFMY